MEREGKKRGHEKGKERGVKGTRPNLLSRTTLEEGRGRVPAVKSGPYRVRSSDTSISLTLEH